MWFPIKISVQKEGKRAGIGSFVVKGWNPSKETLDLDWEKKRKMFFLKGWKAGKSFQGELFWCLGMWLKSTSQKQQNGVCFVVWIDLRPGAEKTCLLKVYYRYWVCLSPKEVFSSTGLIPRMGWRISLPSPLTLMGSGLRNGMCCRLNWIRWCCIKKARWRKAGLRGIGKYNMSWTLQTYSSGHPISNGRGLIMVQRDLLLPLS